MQSTHSHISDHNRAGADSAPCCGSGGCSAAHGARKGLRLWPVLLLIPLALIGLAALGFVGIAMLNIGSISNRARHDATVANLHNIGMMLKTYHLDNGVYPPTLSALVPKYADRVPADAWRRPLGYSPLPAGSPHPFVLYSTGESGTQGNPDNIDFWTDVETAR